MFCAFPRTGGCGRDWLEVEESEHSALEKPGCSALCSHPSPVSSQGCPTKDQMLLCRQLNKVHVQHQTTTDRVGIKGFGTGIGASKCVEGGAERAKIWEPVL